MVRDGLDPAVMSLGDLLAVSCSYLVDGITTQPDLLAAIKHIAEALKRAVVLREEWGMDADEMDAIPPAIPQSEWGTDLSNPLL